MASTTPDPASFIVEIETLRSKQSEMKEVFKALQAHTENLENEQRLLHTLIDNIPDVIYFKDSHSRFVLINKSGALKFGSANPLEIIGKTDRNFFAAEHAEAAFHDEQEILTSGKPLIVKEERETYQNQSDTWALSTKMPMRDKLGNIIGTCGISRDITAIKLAEADLERERNQLRTLIDNMPDYIYIKDVESRFVINNRAHLTILGAKTQAEVLCKTDFDFFSRELVARYFSDEQVVLQTGKPIINREEPTKDKHDRKQWLSTTKVPIRDTAGLITGLVGISRDITERKNFEDALKRANDELELRVAERTTDLQKANERLAERLNQLNFLTTSSYELAQYTKLSELATAIISTFTQRFTKSEIVLHIRKDMTFKHLSATPGFFDAANLEAATRSLDPYLTNGLQRPFMISDWTTEESISGISFVNQSELPCYIVLPLLADNKDCAIIQIFTQSPYVHHYDAELPLLTTLAAHAAVCVSNAVHYQELGERARLQGELDAARSIQQRFAPREKPQIANLDIKGVYYPAFEVGGDYLDYFQTGNGSWVVVIADVCGKGIPAALFMTMLRSTFRVEARTAKSARQLLCVVNESMKVNLDDKSFVTALCCMIAPDGQSMTLARAGHPMLIMQESNGAPPRNIKCAGLALGLVSGDDTFEKIMEEITIPLVSGNRFLLYTDGLNEANDPDKNDYGIKRIFELLHRDKSTTPEGVIDTIMSDVKMFIKDAPYHDDLTIISMIVK